MSYSTLVNSCLQRGFDVCSQDHRDDCGRKKQGDAGESKKVDCKIVAFFSFFLCIITNYSFFVGVNNE